MKIPVYHEIGSYSTAAPIGRSLEHCYLTTDADRATPDYPVLHHIAGDWVYTPMELPRPYSLQPDPFITYTRAQLDQIHDWAQGIFQINIRLDRFTFDRAWANIGAHG